MKRAWLGVAVLSLLANAGAAATPERWLHVSVESGKNGEMVHVNVPLSLAEKILPTINHGDLHNGKIRLHEAEVSGVDLRAILDAVRTAPDNEFVTVQSNDQNVRVAKQAGKLVIHVLDRRNNGQKVDVQIPMPVVEALVSSGTQDLDIVAALHALGQAGDTMLVTVQDAADHVRIWIDAKSGSEWPTQTAPRRCIVILGKIALGALGTVVLGGAVLCSEGIITVRVQEHKPNGSHVFVVAPAMLVPIGVRLAPRERLQEAERQVRPYLPTIRAAAEELAKCSNATFVEVQSPDQHVRISKSWGAIVIDVDDRDETVHVSVPIGAVQSAIEELASAGPTA